MSFKWSWSSRGCNSGRQACFKKTVTTYTSDGRQIVTTYEGGQPVGTVQNATCSGKVTHPAGSSTANVTSGITQKGDFTQFELECLAEHNSLRARHGCPPLKLNRNLCSFANEWAQYLLSRNILQHRSNNKYGENLYMSSGMSVNGHTAVKSWYDEIQHYKFGSSGGFSMSTGHFTQVVWKNCRELGVAIATRGSTSYVVANYDPPGNYSGQFAANVPAPIR